MKERIERKLDSYIAKILEKENLTAEDFGLLVSYYSWMGLRDLQENTVLGFGSFGGKTDGL